MSVVADPHPAHLAAEPAYLQARMRAEWLRLRDAGLLLDTARMARFVADGYLRFDALVPDEINRDALRGFEDGSIARGGGYLGTPLAGAWDAGHPIGRMLALPAVRGLIASLVGPEPRYDHHAVHLIPPRHRDAQHWHADAAIDPKPHFDVQLMWFPQETTRAMGGTLFLPGSHLRMIHESEAARYQNFRGQVHTVCPAGTLLALHHGLWHCGQPNATDAARWMFKLRLNPTVRQQRLWDARTGSDQDVHAALGVCQPWLGSDHRLEVINRVRLWRLLSGDDRWDGARWFGGFESDPRTVISE